jgi:hypothetical protein
LCPGEERKGEWAKRRRYDGGTRTERLKTGADDT